ncbi:MAG: PQQ-binding-like beta-propeller repeat protein [Planctomycetia bacterium]|nr:PQQ-binding-like beta-propeller repeat protein [Planctomycetia bacterium]
MIRLSLLVAIFFALPAASVAADPKDWPSYNGNAAGWRYNSGETALGKANAEKLVEKWRFPATGSDLKIGVVHATPVVVEGCVYFGTVNQPTFYKLSPDGKLKWSYTLTARLAVKGAVKEDQAAGTYGSALVTDDAVYFADLAGYLYALDRKTGKEKWKVDTRAKDFPDAHPLNGTFASPILADGKIVFAGGAFEQWYANSSSYKACNGRAFVVALEPQTGKVAWKYDVGPKPEPLDPPIKIKDGWGEHVFHFGPATSTIWSTPSFDAATKTIFFGTDTNNAPRKPTKDNPRLDTDYACAVIAIDSTNGKEKWVRQINRGDVWHRGMRAYDPDAKRYLDQSIGDTPKVYDISVEGKPTKVVGFGCKNGGFYVVGASDGTILDHTPIYTGKPTYPLTPAPDKRMLALPGPLGGLQTGCATDGKNVFTNGLDAIQLGTQDTEAGSIAPPTGGRVVSISSDTRTERWRHERPKTEPAGKNLKALFKEVGDPVASGVAVANDVVYFTTTISKRLVILDATNGKVLKEIEVGAVWSGPCVSRGRVYVATGNILFSSHSAFSLFPHNPNGAVISLGLPGADEVSRLGEGKE